MVGTDTDTGLRVARTAGPWCVLTAVLLMIFSGEARTIAAVPSPRSDGDARPRSAVTALPPLAAVAAAVPGRPDARSRAGQEGVGPGERIAAVLAEAAKRASGHFSVAVAEPGTGPTAVYAPDAHRFVTASIVKANVLAALLLRAQDEGRGLTPRERELSRRMIQVSDNTATDALWRQIGSAGGLAVANTRLGLVETVPGQGGHWGLTTTTARDQLRLLKALATAQSPLTVASRGYALELMTHIQAGQDWGVSAAADPAGTAALKNGWLPRSATGLWVINSIGVVDHHGRRLIVAALSDDQPSRATGIDLVEGAASAAVGAITSPRR
jgi:beta-lactamase class A